MTEKQLKKLKPPPGGSGVQPPAPFPKDPDKVWLSLERKYRVASYESLSVGLGATSSLHPGEDLRDGLRRVFAQLREEFNDVVEVMREQEEC